MSTVAGWATRARRRARRARRRAALVQTARRVDAAVASLREASSNVTEVSEPPRPTVAFGRAHDDGGGVPCRVALVDALGEAVAAARAADARLSAAVVDADAVVDDALVAQLAAIADARVYLVGPRSVAIVFPALGRAAALGVLARIQAAHGFQGRVVEWERDEDGVELAVRLLTRETA